MCERGIGSHDLDQASVQHLNISCQPADTTTRKPQQHCVLQHRGGILGSNLLISELAANTQNLGQPLNRRRRPLCSAGRHDGDKGRDYPRIEPIAFSQNSTRFGELPQLEWIDLMHRHVSREQDAHHTTFVASACFETDRCNRKAAQLLGELGPTGRIIAHRPTSLFRQHYYIQTILRHIDTAEGNRSHLRIPFLLIRARAQATVRVWKKRPELQAHSRIRIRDACGLPVATGAMS